MVSPANYTMERRVPYKTIAATIAMVVATYLLWQFIRETWSTLQLILIAAFLALALNPAVDFLQQRMKLRRGLSTAIVVIVGVGLFVGLGYLFIRPIVDQTTIFISNLPGYIEDASNGKNSVGRLIERYQLDQYVRDNQAKLQGALTSSTTSIIDVASTVFSTVISLLTVAVLAVMMLLEGPRIIRAPLVFFKPETRIRIAAVASDASRAVTGYTIGQLLMCTIAGATAFITMSLLGVPYPLVLAVWVAFCALIPLFGSTLGAIGTVGVSLLTSMQAGIIAFIVYIVYQQIENNFLQPAIMSRTVRLNPLTVLVSVLIGVQLLGILGAVLAIPVSGALHVIGRDLYDRNRGRFGGEPTVGEDRTPASDVISGDPVKEIDKEED